MNSHETAASDMEKRIELEKRGRAAEEVSDCAGVAGWQRCPVTLTEFQLRDLN